MNGKKLSGVSVILSLVLVSVLVVGLFPIGALAGEETRAENILRVGAQDDTKTRNIFGATDVWTSNVLTPVYEGVGQVDPDTEDPIPYILKGIDADDDGVLDLDEYGVYGKETGTEGREVTAYYDMNWVYSHDGVQMTMDDLLFGYHINALDPLTISLDVLKDKNNLPGSNYSTSRWLNVWPVQGSWDPAIPLGPDTSLTFALHFSQTADYANFVKYTLNGATVMPRHVWEGTGKICLEATNGVCTSWKENIHADFGYAYDPVTHNGVPAAAQNSFSYSAAEEWLPSDDEVIGTGAFEFDIWNPGVSALLNRFEDYFGDALACTKDPVSGKCAGEFYKYMHKPYIEGMLFKIYKTAQAAVFALQAGEIDVVSWSVPPEFVGGLLVDPNIGIFNTAEKGFFYLSYNMRMSPFGYPNNDPSLGDDGLYLRKAMAHVIDKKTIVTTLLQNFGVAGDQPVSPAFTTFYNGSVQKYDFELDAARQLLDDHYTVGGLSLGYGPNGYRNLPTIGDRPVDILCPQADYDPIRASACNMIAANARDVGLNFHAKLLAFGEIVTRLDNRDMEMWVLGWRIGSDPPDYYHAFFYSGNAPAGQNYEGFQNETFDNLITAARATLDADEQAELIKECSGILMDAVPYDVLYFRTNIEAYRSDRYDNWTVGPAGSIFGGSFWSRIGIHAPSPDALTISPPVMKSDVASGSTEDVAATVRDPDGNVVAGAPVQMTLSGSGALGNLSIPGGETGTTVNGVTNINGKLVAKYLAPTVANETEVFVSAQALEFGEYPASTVQFSRVDVHPPGTQFLSVLVEPTFFAIEEGGTMTIEVTVTDQAGVAVDGALVNLVTIPSGPTLAPDSGTTIVGSIGTIVFTAPESLPEGLEEQLYTLTVTANLTGYLPAEDSKDITILAPTLAGGGGGSRTEVPALDVVATVAVIALVTVSLAVYRGTKRR
ncbi:MAG: ABC transporter substrate-binding protein [Thermoplasmata archaeon]